MSTKRNECGVTKWYNSSGQLHRIGGPAVKLIEEVKRWYIINKLHRLNGPATIEGGGITNWYSNGKPHRINGHAIECINGSKLWYISGNYYSEADYNRIMKAGAPCISK